jgi:4-hydroxy-3-methylbut-2-enyl diphosphate reductase
LDIAQGEFEKPGGSGKKAWLAETPEEIPDEAFACSVIGLAAGASTPDWVIDEIEDVLEAALP